MVCFPSATSPSLSAPSLLPPLTPGHLGLPGEGGTACLVLRHCLLNPILPPEDGLWLTECACLPALGYLSKTGEGGEEGGRQTLSFLGWGRS